MNDYEQGYADAEQDLEELGLDFVEMMVKAFTACEGISLYSVGYETFLNVHKERFAQ